MVVRSSLKILGLLLAVLLFLGAVVGVGGYLALRNFDPNMFRTGFEKQLSLQTGLRAELGDVKLSWAPQPQLRVAGLSLYHPQSAAKILQSDRIEIDLDLSALFQKRFTISRIMIEKPELFLGRDPQGLWNWQVREKTPAAAPAAAVSEGLAQPVEKAAAVSALAVVKGSKRMTEGWEFGIGKVLVKDGILHFTDQTAKPAYDLDIQKLEGEVQEPALDKVFRFKVSGAVLRSSEKNLEAEGTVDPSARSLEFLLRYGADKAVFQGRLQDADRVPRFEGTLETRDLDIESVTPAAYQKGEHLAGRLNAKIKFSCAGATPPALERSLTGQGTLEVLKGALKNRNLIREIFDRLSPVMTVTSALGGELPPEVAEMLKDRDTPFESLQVVCVIEKGVADVREFRLTHANYQLTGRAAYDVPEKRIASSLSLTLSRAISAYLMKKIREMEFLADRNGQVVVPFRCDGALPKVSVQPDLNYVGQRLLQQGADQLLERGLERLSKYLEKKRKK